MDAIGSVNLFGILHNKTNDEKKWLATTIRLARDGNKEAYSAVQLLNSTMNSAPAKQCTDEQLQKIWSQSVQNLIQEANDENDGAIGNLN